MNIWHCWLFELFAVSEPRALATLPRPLDDRRWQRALTKKTKTKRKEN